ncbi:DUF2157 domain-containing protein [Pseudomonas sp. M30-35]|uniref:DUF2157 domain-containing protein n=1 Tax=Pseudomonas sp. M30-35 TaxID=1981174 RepID=UPI000B3CE592|nr:DUF2157 domain-containing protein [Pseudomonas sp. M30-35]ARU89462.1 DUF2157 domain-containing protein [Pseudomonas sp. M30-35]
MRLTIQPTDLHKAVAAGVLAPGQDAALLSFLQQQNPERASFQLAHIAYYFGAMLIIGAMGWLLTEAWMNIGEGALLIISAAYMLLFTLCGRSMWQRGQQIPGGLLGAVAVSMTPLLIFAVQRLMGWWPLDDGLGSYNDYYKYVQSGWLAMELGTVMVGVLMLRMLPFPFIVMPIAIALWFMSMDLTELLFGSSFDWEQRRWISLWFGLLVLLCSLWVDGRSQRDYAFWGYLAGLLAFWGGLSMMDSGSELGKALYCLINLGLIAVAVLLRRAMFMVFGALGVASYLGYLSYEVFADSLLFPVIVSLLGLAVIGLGIVYQRQRDAFSAKLRRKIPSSWQSFLPALRR